MRFKTYSILIFSFSIISCTGQLPQNSEHETPNNDITMEWKMNIEDEKIIHQISKLVETEDQSTFLADSKSLYLDLDIWKNTKVANTAVFQKFIDKVQYKLINLPYKNRWPHELKEHFDKFCNAQLEDCWGLSTLKVSANITQILLDIARNETDISKKYKFIFLAFEIQNKNLPKELMFSFFP